MTQRLLKCGIGMAILVIAVVFSAVAILNAWVGWHKNDQARQMHEGHIIVNEIKAHDPTISATWSTAGNHPEVVVRNVFDVKKQDMIVGWAKGVKQQGRVRRRITLEFHKEITGNHVPDTILRAVEF
jgi:hypothetical protein